MSILDGLKLPDCCEGLVGAGHVACDAGGLVIKRTSPFANFQSWRICNGDPAIKVWSGSIGWRV